MTTLAFDGRYLVTDSMLVQGNIIPEYGAQKIWIDKKHGYVYAGAGHWPNLLKCIQQVMANPDELPELDETMMWRLKTKGKDKGLIEELASEFVENGTWCPTVSPTATGSGKMFALAFLSLKRTAKEAIRETIKLDINTGGGINVYDLKTGELTYE